MWLILLAAIPLFHVWITDAFPASQKADLVIVCTNGTFHCGKDQCVPQAWVCDTDLDCETGADESESVCGPSVCKDSEFQCENPKKCIPKNWRCDFEQDCMDGTDEKNCSQPACNLTEQFSCYPLNMVDSLLVSKTPSEQKCIPKHWVCDSQIDCEDGIDEANCASLHSAVPCLSSQFRCASGQCIPRVWYCDLDADCLDYSDETNCTNASLNCTHNEFQCGDGHCVPKMWRCDDDQDCSDSSDEINCHENRTKSINLCEAHEWECYDGECIQEKFRCDGTFDCTDETDELNCNVTCIPSEFKCTHPAMCIASYLRCNDRNDCADGSDELDCAEFSPTSNPPQSCETPGVCSQICEITPNGHLCKCFENFELQGDMKSCKALGSAPALLIGTRDTLREYYIDTGAEMKVASFPSSVNSVREFMSGMDFVVESSTLFVSSGAPNFLTKYKIVNHTLDEENHSIPFPPKETEIHKFAVDWVHNLVFWIGLSHNETTTSRQISPTISVLSLSTNFSKVIISDNLDEANNMAVDPSVGLIFWTCAGASPKIESAAMDGTRRTPIVTNEILEPTALALDLYSKRIFWMDAKIQAIYSANYNGSGRSVVDFQARTIQRPFSMLVFEDFIYYTDLNVPGVHRINKFYGTELSTFLPGLEDRIHIKMAQTYAQPYSTNKCAYRSCSHICLPISHHTNPEIPAHCACAAGYELSTEEAGTCVKTSELAENGKKSAITPAYTMENNQKSDGASNAGVIAAPVTIGIMLLAILLIWIAWYVRRKRNSDDQFGPRRFSNASTVTNPRR